MKKFFAEVIGTFMLVFIGTGAVVFGNGTEGLGHLGIALAFGLSIVAAAYSIGTVSGAHLNPAVSIAMFVNKRLSSKDLVNYIVAQVVGAFLATASVFFLLSNSGMSKAFRVSIRRYRKPDVRRLKRVRAKGSTRLS